MNRMKESSYKEKMAGFRKRKKTAKNRIDELSKDIKEQQAIIKKTDYEMLTLGMEYSGISAEKTVELIENKIMELKEQEQLSQKEKTEDKGKIYGGTTDEF